MVLDGKTRGRRSFVKVVGSTSLAGMAGLAGCTGGSNGDGGGGDGGDGGNENGGGDTQGNGGGGMDPIKIGLVQPLSGPISASGQEALEGAQIAAERLNANGGLGGREIELVTGDSEASPETAVKRARQLIQQDDVEIIIGAVSSAVTKALNQFTSEEGVVHLTSGSSTPDVTKKECRRTFFRVNVNLIHHQRATIELLVREYGDLTRVAGIEPDYVYGHQSWEVFQEEFPQRVPDAELLNVTYPAFLKGDYKKEIQATLDADPEIVHSTLYSGDMVSFIKQAKQFNFFEEIDLFLAGVVPMEVTLALGEAMPDNTAAMANSYFRLPDPDGHPPLKNFNQEYVERFGAVPTLFSIDTHVAFEVLQAAADQAGGTSADDLIDGIEGLQLDTIKGPLTMRAEDHQGIQGQVPAGPLGPLGEPELADLYGHKEIYGFDPVIPIPSDAVEDDVECTF